MNRNHEQLSKNIVTFLQGLRGGVQGGLHVPAVCVTEKAAADAIAQYMRAIAQEMITQGVAL